MKNLEILTIDKDKAYEVIRKSILECRIPSVQITNVKFHHNTLYKYMPNVIKYGLLSHAKMSIAFTGKPLTFERYHQLDDDENCVNGANYVSLSNQEDDFEKMYRDESIYYSNSTTHTDILVSSDVLSSNGKPPMRMVTNYFNEFLIDEVKTSSFKSIDVRIIGTLADRTTGYSYSKKFEIMVSNYNQLSSIAQSLNEENLDIPMREMSEDNVTLDRQKVLQLPRIIISNN